MNKSKGKNWVNFHGVYNMRFGGMLEMYIDNNITYKISCFNGMTKPILFKYFFLDFFFDFFSILLLCTDYYVRKILCKKICGKFYLYIFFFVGSLVELTFAIPLSTFNNWKKGYQEFSIIFRQEYALIVGYVCFM